MIKTLKSFLKKHSVSFRKRKELSDAMHEQLQNLKEFYQEEAKAGHFYEPNSMGMKVFSQEEEDGILLYLFSLLGMDNKTFVEIGSDDGINSNSANLAIHFGWHGLFIDGNSSAIARGRYFYSNYYRTKKRAPKFLQALVKTENVNSLIQENGFQGEIGLLSIDIDGNDYWIWKEIEVIQPQIVIIETHNEFVGHSIVVPYDPNYTFPGKHPLYHGASPEAMSKLAKSKGYRLVAANELGFNFIFLRNDLLKKEVPTISVADCLQHPSVLEDAKAFEEIKDWEYIQV